MRGIQAAFARQAMRVAPHEIKAPSSQTQNIFNRRNKKICSQSHGYGILSGHFEEIGAILSVFSVDIALNPKNSLENAQYVLCLIYLFRDLALYPAKNPYNTENAPLRCNGAKNAMPPAANIPPMKKFAHPELLPPVKDDYTKEDLGKFFWDEDMGIARKVIKWEGEYVAEIDVTPWAHPMKRPPKCWIGPDPRTPDGDNNW